MVPNEWAVLVQRMVTRGVYTFYFSHTQSQCPVVSTCCFTGIVRVGVEVPQDGNRANWYEHVAAVHEHVWRTLFSDCGTGARTGTGWFEFSTRLKSDKLARARGGGAWAKNRKIRYTKT